MSQCSAEGTFSFSLVKWLEQRILWNVVNRFCFQPPFGFQLFMILNAALACMLGCA